MVSKNSPAKSPAKPAVKKPAANSAAKPASTSGGVVLPKGYKPSEKEAFMNPRQLEYFRQVLLTWRKQLQTEISETLTHLSQQSMHEADTTDRAQLESGASLELRTRDRESKLLGKIDAALKRIDDGSYGYCEETGEPISLARLMARPIASLSLDAQERHERKERTYRDD